MCIGKYHSAKAGSLSLLLLTLLLPGIHYAQPLMNVNGATVTINTGANVYVDGGLHHFSAPGFTGNFNNAGSLTVKGDLRNDADLLGTGNSDFRIAGNWINNSNFSAGQSIVDLDGNAQQITGTSRTIFNNLTLSGGQVIKSQQGIDAEVAGILNLKDAELATGTQEMLVSNASASAITRSSGYVSSTASGRLSRATASTGTYLFPLGLPGSAGFYRPLEISPNSASPDTIGSSLFPFPDSSGYFSEQTVAELCKVNPGFYHNIYSDRQADVKMFYQQTQDGVWTDIAQWRGNLWNNTSNPALGSQGSFSTVKINGWNNFSSPVFALAARRFTLDAGPDVRIFAGESVVLDPQSNGLGVNAFQWAPTSSLSCEDCRNPTASPQQSTLYQLTATDVNGCTAVDSVWVILEGSEILLPSAFSPNNDGSNDLFRALNNNIETYQLEVYNRWGELVFAASNPKDAWDGSYKGEPQELGVYIWQARFRLRGSRQTQLASGNVTLIR